MRVSKQRVNQHLERQLFAMLYQVVADTKNSGEAKTILGDLLSPEELTVLAKRLGIAYWLAQSRTPVNIKENLKVSSATIAQIQKRMKNSGFAMALGKIEAEEWATRWARRLRKLVK